MGNPCGTPTENIITQHCSILLAEFNISTCYFCWSDLYRSYVRHIRSRSFAVLCGYSLKVHKVPCFNTYVLNSLESLKSIPVIIEEGGSWNLPPPMWGDKITLHALRGDHESAPLSQQKIPPPPVSRKEGGVFSRVRDYLRVWRVSLDGLRKKRDCSYSDAEKRRRAGELISPNFVPRGFSVKNQMERTVCCWDWHPRL